jgi:diguanylate cyclase (GGDEF)-like protein/PAS domain S-box-containing protein
MSVNQHFFGTEGGDAVTLEGRKNLTWDAYDSLRNLIEASHEPFLAVGIDGRIQDVNLAAEKATGCDRGKLVGRDFADYFAEPEKAREFRRLVMSQGSEVDHPLSVRGPNGELDGVRVSARTLRDNCGRVNGFLVVARGNPGCGPGESASRESEARFRAVINVCPVPMVLNDGAQNIIYVNPEFVRTFGYTLDEIPTLTDWRRKAYPDVLYRDRIAESWEDRLDSARRGGASFLPLELEVRCKDGTIKTVVSSATALGKSFEGAYLVTLYDVTDRMRAMEALAESRNVLESVIETIPIRVFWKDRESRYLGCNSVFAADAGASSPLELVGKDDFQVAWREQAEIYCADDRRVMDSGTPSLGYEEPQTTPDGRLVWLRTSKLPLRNASNEIIGVLGTYEDISNQKRIEQELRLTQAAIDKSKSAFYLVDSKGRVVYANDHACRSLGYTRDELIGLHIWDFDPNFRPEAWPGLWAKQKQGGVVTLESCHRRKDGTVFPIEVTANHISHDGQEHGFVLVQDISDRKRADAALRQSEERLQQAVRVSDIGMFDHDQRSDTIYWSPEQRKIYGWDLDEPVTLQKYIACVYPDDREKIGMDVRRAHDPAGDGVFDVEHRIVRRDGEIRWLTTRARTFFEGEGQARHPVRTLGAVVDVTERRHAEQELQIAATAFESGEGLMITDAEGVILRVNKAFKDLTGYSAEEAIGRNPSILKSGRQDPNFYHALWQALAREGHWQGEIWNRRKNGEEFPEWLSINSVRNAAGQITNYVGNFSDISEKKAAEEEIRNLAFFDPLTRLPNRRLLVDRLQHALAASARKRCLGAILFIDLDNFKRLNDTKGHAVGDLLLLAVSKRLQAGIRIGDTVARLGGDEFVVVLEELHQDREQAAAIAELVGEKILGILNQPYLLQGQEHRSTASIGVSLFRGGIDELEDLLRRSDTAMYEAKKGGRNMLRFFDPAMQEAIEERAMLESWLQPGLERQEFRLHYQPQVDDEGCPFGAEALLRWEHPEHGLISPARFIPLAEETGFIVPLGQWVMEAACAQLKFWQNRPHLGHLTIAVNVSAHQFRQADFVEQVNASVTRHGIAPEKLKLELTESLVLHNVEDTIEKMRQLKAFGICFAMDDFGTGYSSLSYLKRLPLDQLKIDQSFVRDIATDSSDAAIVQTVINMGKTLGLEVIAEGVETKRQLELLQEYGCNAFQGYLFCKPMAVATLEQWVADFHKIPEISAQKRRPDRIQPRMTVIKRQKKK